MAVRYPSEQRFSSNTSADSTRYTPNSNRSMSESRNGAGLPMYAAPMAATPTPTSSATAAVAQHQQHASGVVAAAAAANGSQRNSMKPDSNSNRSSMDVSTCSYNTLIIHPDDHLMYASSMTGSRDYSSPAELVMSTSTASSTHAGVGGKKHDRPRSYGEQVREHWKKMCALEIYRGHLISILTNCNIPDYPTAQGMQEITEIPDDYLNQSHVLKHLAKEIKCPIQRRRSNAQRDSGVVSETAADANRAGGGGSGTPTSAGGSSTAQRMAMLATTPPLPTASNNEPNATQRQQHTQSNQQPPQYEQWIIEEQNEQNGNGKAKSKSQPDLTK